jgi:hypothetical protein
VAASPPASAFEYWLPIDSAGFIHPATLCLRMTILLALGGWPAIPATEGGGLLMSFDAVSEGWFHPRSRTALPQMATANDRPTLTPRPGRSPGTHPLGVTARVHALRKCRDLFTAHP